MGQRIHDHFMIGVPFARAINPISKTNWEGTGVEPDIKVAKEIALEMACKAALEKLLPEIKEPRRREAVEKEIDRLTKELTSKKN